MKAIIETLLADDEIDVIGLVLGMRLDGAESHQLLVDELSRQAAGAAKPLLVVSFISGSLTGHWRGYPSVHCLPLVEDLGRGMRAVRHLVDYGAMRRRVQPRAEVAGLDMPAISGPGVLTEAESKKILGAAGLPVTREKLAKTPEEAVEIFSCIGGKVALKIQSPDIPHKSDVGGVYLSASSADEVRNAARQVLESAARACPQAQIDGVLVQEMIEGAAEFILGMTYDEQFGPLLVCGSGGVAVEIFKDAAVRLPPLGPEEARRMVYELKASKFLDGFRGAAARDADALVDCIVRFSDFVTASDGMFAAIDLNPVLVRPRGQGVRIADALIILRDRKEGGDA
jgi:acetyltransferase